LALAIDRVALAIDRVLVQAPLVLMLRQQAINPILVGTLVGIVITLIFLVVEGLFEVN
jgi:hypothetical protein